MKNRIFIFLGLVCIQGFAVSVSAQETYNFYFQKAPGPNTVIQGSSGQPGNGFQIGADGKVVQPPGPTASSTSPVEQPAAIAAPVASPVTAVVEKKTEAEIQDKRFRVALGYSKFEFFNVGSYYQTKVAYEGAALNLGYRWNPYFGVDFGGAAGRVNNKQEEYTGPYDVSARTTVNQVYAGIVVTPLHLNLFGWNLLEISLLGGAINLSGEGFKARTAGYYGAAFDFIVNPNFSIGLQSKLYDLHNTKYNAVTALASARF
jgi:hypothetical protein